MVDPRTGEIIKGHVSLGSLRVRQDYLIAQGLLAPFEHGMPADNKMLRMALQRLKQLAAHEVGHTLGLMHNYIASTQNRSSVMDYPSPLVSINNKNEIDLSDAYANQIGDWDKVTIAFGYQDFISGTDEPKALNAILTDAAKNGLTFISDRDARDPAGLHPSAHLWDNGKDPVSWLLARTSVPRRDNRERVAGTDPLSKFDPRLRKLRIEKGAPTSKLTGTEDSRQHLARRQALT